MEIKSARVIHDLYNGVVEGKKVIKGKKLFKDAKSFYENANCSLAEETLMYEVYEYSEEDPKIIGNLAWGLTVMYPVLVNEECNMTRGHFHEDLNCAEFYFGLAGEGLLLYMDENGKCFAEEVKPNTIHHTPGKYAHRLINTSDEVFKVGACWPSMTGQNYTAVEKMPFPYRVFKKGNEIIVKER